MAFLGRQYEYSTGAWTSGSMSINIPSTKQIRLPFSVPRPNQAGEKPVRICGICRKRDSRYTCPRCNIAYCDLECFKDEKHIQCSEPFYRSTVLDSIAADSRASMEEKKGMVDMLRRFEEGAAEDAGWLEQLREDEQEDELAAALEGVDIDGMDSNALFHLLPQAHRDRFLAALRDPESDEAKQLLREAAAGGEGGLVMDDRLPVVLPWWEKNQLEPSDEDLDGGTQLRESPYASEPEMVAETVIGAIDPPKETAIKLTYNAIAICLAYLHVLLSFRLPSLSPEYLAGQQVSSQEVKQEVAHLVPFLVDQKSTVRHGSVRDAWSAVWDAIAQPESSEADVDAPATEPAAHDSLMLIRLLSLMPRLLHPPLDTTVPTGCLRLFSDLQTLYNPAKVSNAGPVARKLTFYIAALRKLDRREWLQLEAEIQRELNKLREETGESDNDATSDTAPKNSTFLE